MGFFNSNRFIAKEVTSFQMDLLMRLTLDAPFQSQFRPQRSFETLGSLQPLV